MTFPDIFREVSFLNQRLRPVEHDLGSEVRRHTHSQLWDLVAYLNDRLSLGLTNNALDLKTEGERLVIHYWSGKSDRPPYYALEHTLYIDPNFKIESQKFNPHTGETCITTRPEPPA